MDHKTISGRVVSNRKQGGIPCPIPVRVEHVRDIDNSVVDDLNQMSIVSSKRFPDKPWINPILRNEKPIGIEVGQSLNVVGSGVNVGKSNREYSHLCFCSYCEKMTRFSNSGFCEVCDTNHAVGLLNSDSVVNSNLSEEKKMSVNCDNVNMGKDANAGMCRDDSSTSTRLLDKNWSPLIVRKYQMEGWPLFISLICDANLNDLDSVVLSISDKAKELGFMDGKLQSARNYCGFMSDELCKHYNSVKRGCVEGAAILWYIDKCFISSLYGDFMVHAPCKAELYAIINTLPHI